MDWKKLLLLAGGAAGAAGVLYYLLKEDSSSAGKALPVEEDEKKKPGKVPVDQITKETVLQILQEIIKSQDQMKCCMKDLTTELQSNALTFEETYQKVRTVQPPDPLEKYALSMMDFDQLLDMHQSDVQVRENIAKIMGAPSPSSCASEKAQSISVKMIINVHTFMLEELEALVKDFQKLPNKDAYDMKAVTVAAQAIVGSKIQGKFGFTSEDIEGAVLMYHTMLATDQEFAGINMKIQRAMGQLMGTAYNVN